MTTRASAAAATGLPSDRRSLLSGAALASLVAATAAVPAMAIEQPGPIETAHGVWLRAAKAADAAVEATWAIERLYEAPQRPRYHHFRSQGAYDLEITGKTDDGRTLGRSYLRVDDENVQRLEEMIATPFDPSESDPINIAWDRRSHEQTVEQAKETLQTIETYQAECKRLADACGLTAAQEHERPLMDAARVARDAVFAMTPATFREAAFQAAVLCEDWDEEATSRLNRALADLAGIRSYFEEA